MGGLALEVHFEVGAGNELLLENGASLRMGGNDGVHVIEESGIGHGNLASGIPHVAFLGGRAEHMNGAGGKMTGQRHGGAAGGGTEEIVAAGVTETGQGVEFGKIGHLRPLAGAVHGVEGRGHAEQAAFHLEAVGFEEIGKTGGRLEFLIAQFGFGEDGGGDFPHLVGDVVDFIQDLAFFRRDFGHAASFDIQKNYAFRARYPLTDGEARRSAEKRRRQKGRTRPAPSRFCKACAAVSFCRVFCRRRSSGPFSGRRDRSAARRVWHISCLQRQ